VNAFRFFNILIFAAAIPVLQACSPAVQEKVTPVTTTQTATTQKFADGVKGIKIVTSIASGTGSFSAPSAVPTPALIPSGYPGSDGSATYLPGVQPTQYFTIDGSSALVKPDWLVDFQLGITSTSSSSACAAFGGSGALDAQNYYRISEADCGSTSNGLGGGTDPVFARIVLNRDSSLIGTAENLMIQVEYQASGLHLNSDGSSTNPEDDLDQLWKIFWNSTLGVSSLPKPFAIFVPPNYGACMDSGSGMSPGPPDDHCQDADYKGAPVKVKQILIPLSAYPDMSVIQLTRVKGRINQVGNYVSSFCSSDSPLCLGVVIRSITLMRM